MKKYIKFLFQTILFMLSCFGVLWILNVLLLGIEIETTKTLTKIFLIGGLCGYINGCINIYKGKW